VRGEVNIRLITPVPLTAIDHRQLCDRRLPLRPPQLVLLILITPPFVPVVQGRTHLPTFILCRLMNGTLFCSVISSPVFFMLPQPWYIRPPSSQLSNTRGFTVLSPVSLSITSGFLIPLPGLVCRIPSSLHVLFIYIVPSKHPFSQLSSPFLVVTHKLVVPLAFPVVSISLSPLERLCLSFALSLLKHHLSTLLTFFFFPSPFPMPELVSPRF
jgi:hypothetical protein